MSGKLFAAQFPRNNRGWIKFPADAGLRKQLFPEDAMEHPAKNNLLELQAIIDYLYKPGDLILDPMAGTGSIMIAALEGCKVICIDCSPLYAEMLERSRLKILELLSEAEIIVLEGDCKEFLPIPVTHICFSPPFTDTLRKTAVDEFHKHSLSTTEEHLLGFSAGPGNVGVLSEFLHMQAMESIFKLCYRSLSTAGTATIITRDCIEAGRRIYNSRKYLGSAKRAGFQLAESFKRIVPRTGFDTYNIAKGVPAVDDEDILILRKT